MIPTNTLFEALLSVLPTTYPLKFSYIERSTVSGTNVTVTKNTGALYFRSAGNGQYREVSTGKYKVNSYRLILNLYTDKGESGVLAGLSYCAEVCEILDTLFNKSITVGDDTVFIVSCHKLGNYQYLGPTDQGIASFSLNYLIKFN